MNYKEVRLGDVCKIGRGSSPRPIKDERYFINGEIPWVKIADATASGKYIYNTKEYVNEFGASFSRLLSSGSLIFPASGTLGIPRFLGVDACIHDGWLYFDSFNGIDSEYLYYLLITLKDYYISIAYGAAIQNINTDMLRDTIINLPDLNEQKRIAEYLCNYDNLIENNRKRIALLEESARLLYQEWFVKFRFPDCKIGDEGFPEGWNYQPLSQLIEINPKVTFEKDKLYPFVPMQSLSESNMLIDNIEMRKISGGTKFQNFDTLLARITPCLENGKTGFVQFLDSETPVASGSTEYIVMRSKLVNPYWVYCLARDENFREHIIASMRGSDGRQRVNPQSFDNYWVLHPIDDVLNRFEKIVAPMFEQIQILSISIDKLQKARDELLPKLISGQIKV